MRYALLFLLLAACGPDWDATPIAAARRVGGAHVEGCILEHGGPDHGGCFWKDYCLDWVEQDYCIPAGFPGCSRNEPEGLCS